MFPRIYADEPCPLEGYDLTITLLANPTGDEKRAWWAANLGDPSCADCAALKDAPLPPFDATIEREFPGHCAKCSAARLAFGQSVMVVFQAIGDCDLTTPAACVAAIEGSVPDEVIPWLYQAPSQLWTARSEEIKKKLMPSSTNGGSSSGLDGATPPIESTANSRP